MPRSSNASSRRDSRGPRPRAPLRWRARGGAHRVALLLSLIASSAASADEPPEREVDQRGQVWAGIMTQTRVSDRASLWNDAHFVPDGFFIVRTGATAHLTDNLTMTGGYAYLGLPVAGGLTRDLKRTEHRPWGQIVYTSQAAPAVQILNRIRYDARYRRNVTEGALAPGYGLTHRVRFNLNIRVDIEPLRFGDGVTPYVAVGDEVLLNFGPEVVFNTLDQNRVIGMVGLRRRGIAGQIGYMNRLVQLPTAHRLVMNHTLVGWLFVNIDARKKEHDFEPIPRPQ